MEGKCSDEYFSNTYCDTVRWMEPLFRKKNKKTIGIPGHK
jgi:hypothetical protein